MPEVIRQKTPSKHILCTYKQIRSAMLTRRISHRFINLADATPEDLQALADACEPATFGRNQEDVYDETYRKAVKLDSSNFALKFDPVQLGLVDVIRTEMLEEGKKLIVERPEAGRGVRAELYKLNVYGATLRLTSC